MYEDYISFGYMLKQKTDLICFPPKRGTDLLYVAGEVGKLLFCCLKWCGKDLQEQIQMENMLLDEWGVEVPGEKVNVLSLN